MFNHEARMLLSCLNQNQERPKKLSSPCVHFPDGETETLRNAGIALASHSELAMELR